MDIITNVVFNIVINAHYNGTSEVACTKLKQNNGY